LCGFERCPKYSFGLAGRKEIYISFEKEYKECYVRRFSKRKNRN
jgi:hypothetical protein